MPPPQGTLGASLLFWNKAHEGNHETVLAFEEYQQLSSVMVRSMNAHQKLVSTIVMPFDKHQRLDSAIESLECWFQLVNQHVLRHAPHSVGILVDRGLGGSIQVSASKVSNTIMVPFFGGRDDREALAYGIRMAEHPGIAVSVIRFIPVPGTLETTARGENDDSNDSADDQQTIFELASGQNESISCEDQHVSSKEEITAALTSMNKCDLFIVGRMPPAVAVLVTRMSDCPEMGPMAT